jgi:hypothetical protein
LNGSSEGMLAKRTRISPPYFGPAAATLVAAGIAAGCFADQQIAVTPGRTYRLVASGALSVAGDSATVGIIYRDAAGTRLTSQEPTLTFTATTPSRRSLTFTPPADAATVDVYLWKRSGPATIVVDDVSVREVVSAASPTAAPTTG